MKTFRMTSTVALLLTVLVSLGVASARAQGPTDTPQIAFLDNQTHAVPANSSQLFRFDYDLKDDRTRPVVTIRLVNGTNSGVNFEIWTADQLRAQATTYADALADNVNNQPLGRGVATKLDCDRGIQSGSGTCLSADLTWTGAFGSGGTYFVRIVNANSTETRYQLLIDGATVRLAPLTQIAATTAPTSPAAAPPLVTAADPTKAIAIDGQQHSVAAGTVVWHRFDYDLKDDRTRPVVTIRLVNGTNSGVNFEIWTADQLRAQATTYADALDDNVNNQPLGRGVATKLDCDRGIQSGSGTCLSANLIWTGAFGSGGTYFVKIVNINSAATNYQLAMTVQ